MTSRPELVGTRGMVASTHWLASAAAAGALERGGNAFDAVVTGGFVLQVAEPHLNGPGGEVPAVFATAGGPATVLCGQGVTPAAATVDAVRRLGLDEVPGTGLLAATVPGAFDAWMLLLRDHGTFSVREVLDPAWGYAAAGVPLVPAVHATVDRVADMLRAHWPTSAALWLGPRGPLHRNPELAATWQRVVRESEVGGGSREQQVDRARAVWREGFVAEAVVASVARPVRDSTGRDHAGLLTGQDLAAWSASYEAPVLLEHAGHVVAKTGPWGQGPVALAQLATHDALGTDLADTTAPDVVHAITEVAKLAFADRDSWYGDHPDVPVQELLSPAYARSRAALVAPVASLEQRPGQPAGRAPWLPPRGSGAGAAVGEGEPTVARDGRTRGDTCHIDVVDRWGAMVSATPSGGWLQSSPTIAGLGFCLGTRAQMTWLDEASPSALRPSVRPRTTLSPTLVLQGGEPVLALGTPGGDQQDQWSLLLLLRLLHPAGGSLVDAIDAPVFHTDALVSSFAPRTTSPGSLVVESRLGADAIDALRGRGHTVTVAGPWSLGRTSVVARDPETGVLRAAADPRGRQGLAAGR